jgi:hypothetical protein
MEINALVSKRNKSQVRFSLCTAFMLFVILFMVGCSRASMKFTYVTQPAMLGTIKKIGGSNVEHGNLIKKIIFEDYSKEGISIGDNKFLINEITFHTGCFGILTFTPAWIGCRNYIGIVGSLYKGRDVDMQDTLKNR